MSPIIYKNAVIQKQAEANSDNGVIMHLSFLLFENKFKIVFKKRYDAKIMQITFVALYENHKEMHSPICKMIIIAKNWAGIIDIAIILNFFGKTLSCPPIINSPNGKPQMARIVIASMHRKKIAPVIAITIPITMNYIMQVKITQEIKAIKNAAHRQRIQMCKSSRTRVELNRACRVVLFTVQRLAFHQLAT